ncbi:MAG: hypothetical protein COT43_05880 [Candidatus Marinimicrobia bacterium CG08_land_8_20_14_0_20_45_22]|nr:MAG: hypothetical protein COT43_05880 [Candidatus Marinimicrobia bacterium CG08_land_8_20_14_0_20_45_22]
MKNINETKSMIKRKDSFGSNPDAIFLGWQEMLSGRLIALYNVVARNHPSYGSTVTDRTLRHLKLQIPDQSQPRSNKKNLK